MSIEITNGHFEGNKVGIRTTENLPMKLKDVGFYHNEIGLQVLPTSVGEDDIYLMKDIGFSADTNPKLAAKFLKDYPNVTYDRKSSYLENFSEWSKKIGKFAIDSTSLLSNLTTIISEDRVIKFIEKWTQS